MNWLAHIVLAGPDPADQLGGVVADLVTTAQARDLSAEVRRGIALHHAVDSFTDRHPAFAASCRRLSGGGIGLPAAAAGIAVDMLYDHLLAAHWPPAMPGAGPWPALKDFTAQFYRSAAILGHGLPERARRTLALMSAQDWLASYREIENVRLALEGIRRRLSPRAAAACPLPRAVEIFAADPAAFEEDFAAFWPGLAAHVESIRVHRA